MTKFIATPIYYIYIYSLLHMRTFARKVKCEHPHCECKLMIKTVYILGHPSKIILIKKKSNWKLFSHLITTFIASTLFDGLYLSVNSTTNRWSNNLQFGLFFARMILENKSKWWTVTIIELCCQSVGMHMFTFYFIWGRPHVKGTIYIYDLYAICIQIRPLIIIIMLVQWPFVSL